MQPSLYRRGLLRVLLYIERCVKSKVSTVADNRFFIDWLGLYPRLPWATYGDSSRRFRIRRNHNRQTASIKWPFSPRRFFITNLLTLFIQMLAIDSILWPTEACVIHRGVAPSTANSNSFFIPNDNLLFFISNSIRMMAQLCNLCPVYPN